MPYYLRHDDHLEQDRKIGEQGRKNESDLKPFNKLIRAEEIGNPADKKNAKYVETARKYMMNLDIKCNGNKNGIA